eukprot:254960_1
MSNCWGKTLYWLDQFGPTHALNQTTNIKLCCCLKWSGRSIYIFVLPDVLRFWLVCILLINHTDLRLLLSLLPGALFITFIALFDVYFMVKDCVHQTIRKWRNNDHRFKQICEISLMWFLSIIIIPIAVFFFLTMICVVFPYTSFNWILIFSKPHHAERYFDSPSDDIKNKIYYTSCLQYVLNGKYKNEIFKRIITVNYCLKLCLGEGDNKLFDLICSSHNQYLNN